MLRQEAAVRRYTPRVMLTQPAQNLTPFSGKALHVLTLLHVGVDHVNAYFLRQTPWIAVTSTAGSVTPRESADGRPTCVTELFT